MQTEYIASGDHYVAVNEHKLLKVLLGTCVGVAIYDQDSAIGGIIHLLLPEPASLGSSWSPGSYATTGMPLFLNSLLEAGAKQENLRAVIAGGALFGTISQQDLALNIGGRCVEKVHLFLRDLRIPIIREESCGLTSSAMTLDTASWQYEITTCFEAPSPAGKALPPPSRQEMVAALRTITPIPQTALKIIHLISEEDYETDEVVAAIETDQVLSAKVLSLCNSAMFKTRQPIDSIGDAVLLLGSHHLLQMVATASVDSFLADPPPGGYAMLKGGLYKHALGVAHTARIIAHHHGSASPSVAYTAGLLHDIGKIGLDLYFTSFRPLFYQGHDFGDDLIDLERHLLGMDHQEMGLLLATEWGLPPSLTQAIGHHHRPEQAESHQGLVHLVYLADLLTSWYLTGTEIERINTAALHSRLHFLGLSADQLPNLIERVPWKTIMYL